MRERRRQPQADLISALTRVEEQGDVLSEEDLIVLCDQLLTAGHDTTRTDREMEFWLFCRTRTNYRSFAEDPGDYLRSEELLRYDSPLQPRRECERGF